MHTKLFTALLLLLLAGPGRAQVFLDADSTIDAYTRIQSKGMDYEVPDCGHAVTHIVNQYDSFLRKYVFAFSLHRDLDDDRCINFDRQRNEIKTWDGSPDSLKGGLGETHTYRWKFKLDAAFQPNSNFTHIHQLKAGDGTFDTDNPIITITPRLGTPSKLELIFVAPVEQGSTTTKVAIVNPAPFLGTWVEAFEQVTYGPSGTYQLTIKRVSDDSVMLSYSNSNIAVWRTGITFVRPKYGMYRSLLNPQNLRDETILLPDFYIKEGSSSAVPAAPTTLTPLLPAATQATLTWTDNSTDEQQFRIDRSTDGTNYYFAATVGANTTSFTDTGLTQYTTYYYRVSAENSFGNSSYATASFTTCGNWSSPLAWQSGIVPSAGTDAVIAAGNTVILDIATPACSNLTVNGTLSAIRTRAVSLTVNGNVTINAGGTFTSPAYAPGTANIIHTLTVYGNFANSGGTFDFRLGSAGTTLRAIHTVFAGNSNSTITVGTYSSTNNDFNGITVNKTGGAKIVLGSDVFLDPGSTAAPSQLVFTSGCIETGNYSFTVLSTANADVVTPSATAYIIGSMGRGMNTSGAKNAFFPVGDATAYRPASVRSTTSGLASGHYCTVRVFTGNANSGSSNFTGSIDKVSAIRYYRLSYSKGIGSAADSMAFSQFSPSYGTDDGVVAGNTDLRVAYSTNSRATWSGMLQTTAHTTSLASPPTTITPTELVSPYYLRSNTGYIYFALASISGSSSNPLPVELTSFTGSAEATTVVLNWSTATEIESYAYSIEKKSADGASWVRIGTVKAAGTSNAPRHYRFIEHNAPSGRFLYRLRMIDNDGSFKYSAAVEVLVGIPEAMELLQNYPNPFNPETVIRYGIPEDGTVALTVCNIAGETIATLVHGPQPAGRYSAAWNGTSDAGIAMPAGIYLFKLAAGGRTTVKKMILLR